MTERRLIRLPEVESRVGFQRSWIYSKIRAGTFPSPVRLGRSSAWVESEVLAFIETQIAGRDHGATPDRRDLRRPLDDLHALRMRR